MRLLALTILMLLSLPILMPEPQSLPEVGKGIGDKLEAPVELPIKSESFSDSSTWSEHTCLSLNIYWESKGESERGMILVAQTTMNRVNSDKKYFPNTVCQVVKQKTGKKCTFNWYCNGKSDIPVEPKQYEKAKIIADKALKGEYNGITKALYFKKCTIVSRFFDKLRYLGREGAHCFFNEH